MARLLAIQGTSINKPLISLSQNWIKWLFHIDVEKQIANSKTNSCLHPLKRRHTNLVLKKMRSVSHSLAKSFQISISPEDFNGKRNIQHIFASQQMRPNSFKHLHYNSSLRFYLILISKHQISNFIGDAFLSIKKQIIFKLFVHLLGRISRKQLKSKLRITRYRLHCQVWNALNHIDYRVKITLNRHPFTRMNCRSTNSLVCLLLPFRTRWKITLIHNGIKLNIRHLQIPRFLLHASAKHDILNFSNLLTHGLTNIHTRQMTNLSLHQNFYRINASQCNPP